MNKAMFNSNYKYREKEKMVKFEKCLRCCSENVDKLMVNSHFSLNYPEETSSYTGAVLQRIVQPTDALVCKDCGHIELFIDWENKK
ncbi:MAG: hypothetical protein J6A41_01180 [Ruminiclostridium sp.]|nr:hypothetical protein [Ruminiclostridium sp.]